MGFDCKTMHESLRRLNIALQGRGNMPKIYDDLSVYQMDSNWRFEKVAEDLKFVLHDNPNAYVSPYNMARIAREVGELGYKNIEILPHWFDKLDAMYRRAVGVDPLVDLEKAKVSLEEVMYG